MRKRLLFLVRDFYLKIQTHSLPNIQYGKNLHLDAKDNFDTSIQALQQLKKNFRGKGGTLEDGFTCVQVDCRVCEKSSKETSKPKAFINKRTGLFTCPTCQFNNPFSRVAPMYNPDEKFSKQSLELLRNSFRKSINEQSKKFETKSKDNLQPVTPSVLESIGILIKEPILENLDISYNPRTNSLHCPLRNAVGTIVGEKVLNLEENLNVEETFPEDGCSGLLTYNPQNKPSKKAIVVINVLDYLAVISQKLEVSVICLPYGLKSLPQTCLPGLENIKQIILWLDFDVAGWDTGWHFACKLDEKRCLFIRPTELEPTPLSALKTGLNFRNIISKAQPILHKSITTFSSLKQDVLCELQNVEKVNGVKWNKYPTLNKLLKGHRKGELTILTGPTGCGKTTFMSDYSLDLAMQGVATLWGSFEIRNTRLASTMLRQYVGYPLDDKLGEFDYWTQQIEKLPIFFMQFHGQQHIKVVMEAVEHAQYVHDIHHVIIDNVQFMLGISSSSKHDKFLEQDLVIAAFRAFATKRNVHVTLVMHPRKEKDADDLTLSSIFGSAKATQEADNVLIIQDKRLTSLRGKKYLQIAKNRYSGDLGIMMLDFDKDSLSYSRKKKDREK